MSHLALRFLDLVLEKCWRVLSRDRVRMIAAKVLFEFLFTAWELAFAVAKLLAHVALYLFGHLGVA